MFVRNGWCEPRHGTNPDKALNTRAAGGIGCSHLCRSCCCSKLHSCLVFDVYLVIPFHLLLFVGQAVMISNFHLLMLKSNCALLHAAMFDMTAQGEYRVRLFLGKKKYIKMFPANSNSCALTTGVDSACCRVSTIMYFAHFTQVRVTQNGPTSACETERVAVVCCAGPVMLSLLIY